MKINLSVFYAKKEFIEYNRIYLKATERKRFILLSLIPLLFTIIAIIFLFIANYLGAIFLFIQALILTALIVAYGKEKLSAVTFNPGNRFLFTQYEVILTKEFISTKSNFGFTKVELDYLNQIVMTKNYIAFYHHTLPLILLNKKELDVVDRNEIIALIERHYQGEFIKIDD